MRDELSIPVEGADPISALRYRAAPPHAPVLILAHGAGAGQRSPFMTAFAEAMRGRDVTTVTFDFPYMRQRRRVPDRAPVLEAAWRAVIQHLVSSGGETRVVIGGKSMGGRMASHVLSDPAGSPPGVLGLVLLGYPLHPPGQPERRRVAHLPGLVAPTLVVQGSKDTFGTEEEVREAFAAVPAAVDWLIVPGGDHSFKTSRAAGTYDRTMQHVHETVAGWVHERASPIS